MEDSVVILREVNLHPHSKLVELEDSFEQPSILHIVTRDGLKSYNSPPAFDLKYLVLFEGRRLFESNAGYLKFDFMFPVVLCSSRAEVADIRAFCQEKHIKCNVFENTFEKPDAYDLIRSIASEPVSDNFCKTLVSRVGLSPQRIISATMICEQVGYRTSNITKYVDKYTYIDIDDVISSLLGIAKSKAQCKRAALFLHTNRLWYKRYTKDLLIGEVDKLTKIFKDYLEGTLTSFNLRAYIEKQGISRHKAMYVLSMMEKKSLNDLLALRSFLENASLLEVVMKLS